MDDRQCSRCGTWYPAYLVERAFRVVGNRYFQDVSRKFRLTICRPCEQTARDQRKIRNRWRVKANDVIRRHALRLEIPKDQLIRRYGWDPDRLAHDAEFQYGNGCNYCGERYQTMGHGLADITLDVQDKQQPYYRTNTKWCCQTCNRKKGTLNPEEFEADRQVYEEWTRQAALTAAERGMLF
jgi:hypothetical protein